MLREVFGKKQVFYRDVVGEHGRVFRYFHYAITEFWECVDCKTVYPVLLGKIMCNKQEIKDCPFCQKKTVPAR